MPIPTASWLCEPTSRRPEPILVVPAGEGHLGSPSLEAFLGRWLTAFVETPGLTAVRDLEEARSLHIDDALTAAPLLAEGTLVDVGSGGGSPAIPLAVARPSLSVTLLEANGKKATFLERWAGELENATVKCVRAEDYAAGDGFERFDNATARALAPPAVAIEWALPLLRIGGRFILFTTLTHEPEIEAVAPLVGGRLARSERPSSTSERILCVIEKTSSTPVRFPRRAGVARKRPIDAPVPSRKPTLGGRAAP